MRAIRGITLGGTSNTRLLCRCALGIGLAFAFANAMAGNITGTVSSERGVISDIRVEFFDALNAELLGSSVTGATGMYNSGELPDGSYRIRFSGTGAAETGFYDPEFFGADVDEFCAATEVQVWGDSTSVVDETLRSAEPTQIVVERIGFSGSVTDAETGLVLPDIRVQFLNYRTGEEAYFTVTDSSGLYGAQFEVRGYLSVRVRFSDSNGNYFPEYQGAGDTDSFCLGTVFTIPGARFSTALSPIPPDTQDIIDEVADLGLPSDVTGDLNTPLARAADALSDDTPENDLASCGHLTAFASRVLLQERRGQLTGEQADALLASTEALQTELGCP